MTPPTPNLKRQLRLAFCSLDEHRIKFPEAVV